MSELTPVPAIGSPDLIHIIDALLLAARTPLRVDQITQLFADKIEDKSSKISGQDVRKALLNLQAEYAGQTLELKEVATGWRLQIRPEFAPWIAKLQAEKPSRYSRALMETLAIIAYRQPVTRGDIEQIRGVAVSSNIVRTLEEREWIKVVGHKEVPGHPALFATTAQFLDYFNLKRLDELPTLAEIRDLDHINLPLALAEDDVDATASPDDDSAEPDPIHIHATATESIDPAADIDE